MNRAAFFEKFDLFAGAPDAIAKMRELVLELAVSGKLVAQSSDDELAFKQLQRIAAKKSKTGRVARVKAGRTGNSAAEETETHVPDGWERTSLAELVSVLNGRAYSKDELLTAGTPVLRVGNLFTSKHWYYSDLELEPDKYCDNEDLIFAWSASFGPFVWPGPKVIYHYHIWKLELHSEADLHKSYLYWFLQNKTQEIKRAGHGVSMLHMTKEKMEKLEVMVPPLAEQKRIVTKVDELMALCDRLEAQQQERETLHAVLARASLARFADAPTSANLQFLFYPSYPIAPADLRKSILTLAVQGKLVPQDPHDEPAEVLLHRLRSEKLERISRGTMRKLRSNEDSFVADKDTPLPAGWALGCVADFGAPEDNAIVDGPFGSNLKLSDYDPQGVYPVITISNIDEGFDLATLRKVTEKKFQKLKRSAVRANDILVAKIGSSYGKVGLYPGFMPVGIIPANLLKIAPHPSMDWRFLVSALRSPDFKAELETIVQFTAQPAFGVSKFKLLPISIPPLAEQRRIVAKVEQLMALVDELETQLSASRTTASNLLSAIVAELTKQDSTETALEVAA